MTQNHIGHCDGCGESDVPVTPCYVAIELTPGLVWVTLAKYCIFCITAVDSGWAQQTAGISLDSTAWRERVQ